MNVFKVYQTLSQSEQISYLYENTSNNSVMSLCEFQERAPFTKSILFFTFSRPQGPKSVRNRICSGNIPLQWNNQLHIITLQSYMPYYNILDVYIHTYSGIFPVLIQLSNRMSIGAQPYTNIVHNIRYFFTCVSSLFIPTLYRIHFIV